MGFICAAGGIVAEEQPDGRGEEESDKYHRWRKGSIGYKFVG
jgi:hypothetical protein